MTENDDHSNDNLVRFPVERVRSDSDGHDDETNDAQHDDPTPSDAVGPVMISDGPTGIVDAVVRLKEHSPLVHRAMHALPEWITPNGVTLFRAVLTAPLVLLLLSKWYWSAIALFVFAMLLDFVDGALAHVRGMKSELGAFLDPLADKITVCAVLLTLAGALPGSTYLAAWVIALFAVFLTTLRISRMSASHGSRPNAPGIDALSVGKMKLLTETAAISLLLLALATSSTPLMAVASFAIWVAAALGFLSYMGQVFR